MIHLNMDAGETTITSLIEKHITRLRACRRCRLMQGPVVSGGPVVSKIILVGQAPGDKEPVLGRPFAWTAGKTLFGWFQEAAGLPEEMFRQLIYMAAVCRCFPGKRTTGGDRVPSDDEIANCASWLRDEFAILKPELVIPVGKLAIAQFLPQPRLDRCVGRSFRTVLADQRFDTIPLPHPSGASPWHRIEPGRTLLAEALGLISRHPSFQSLTNT